MIAKNLNEARKDSIVRQNETTAKDITDIAKKYVLLQPGTVINPDSTYLAFIATGLQKVSYSYNIRGNLRGINLTSTGRLDSSKVFALKLDYFEDGRYYNGNLSRQSWKTSKDTTTRRFLYDYDAANRFTNANFTGKGNEKYGTNTSYDANGNILTLNRKGLLSASTWGQIDSLAYTYPNYQNRLTGIIDNASSTIGFKDNGNSSDFTYYNDGSLKTDANKGITNIVYNYLGLPERIEFGANQRIENVYAADGQKLYQKIINGSNEIRTDYVGDLIYRNDTLVSIMHDEGKIRFDEQGLAHYQYFISDHLGNTRVIFEKLSDSVYLAQESHYGVWGEILQGIGNSGDWKFLFQGKEYVDAFGYNEYDFHYRQYDPFAGRFLTIDPKDQFASGYLGMGNMPTMGVDPDGQVFFIIPQIGWSKKGGLSVGIEVGVGVPGVLSASLTGGYNFGSKQGYWSAQGYASGFYAGYGSQGGFAGWGYRYGGFSAGISYGQEGLGVGLNYGATKNNYNGSVGIGWSEQGGFDFNVSGGYTKILEKPVITKINEYNLKGAPPDPIKQRGGYDCLICANEYLSPMTMYDDLEAGMMNNYDDIMNKFNSLYNPQAGTSTKAALESLYGVGSISAYESFSPNTVGKQMKLGNPVIVAQNRDHAIVPTKIEVFGKAYKYSRPKTVFNITYMNPATGSFQSTGKVRSFNYPTFIIKLK